MGSLKVVSAPMASSVVEVLVDVGSSVQGGQPLVIVEAMKMEHTISAPRDGRVRKVNVAVGDRVAAGVELIAMDEP